MDGNKEANSGLPTPVQPLLLPSSTFSLSRSFLLTMSQREKSSYSRSDGSEELSCSSHNVRQEQQRRNRRTITFAGIFLASLLYLYTQSLTSSTHRSASLPPNHASLRTRCQHLKLKPVQPPSFPTRAASDRYVPGTRPVLISNATIWTGRVNGLEIIKGDLVLDKGLIKAVGVVPKDLLRSLEEEEVDVIDAKGAWVTPG